jgi:predicted esterase
MYTVEKIQVDGRDRTYVLHVPNNMKVQPDLLIGCHGGSSNGVEWYQRAWQRQANKGFLIICPTGSNPVSGTNWVAIGDGYRSELLNEHHDERFILAIMDQLRDKYGVKNVFMSGFSSGAKMTHHMYVTQRAQFAGFGMTGHGPYKNMVDAYAPDQPARSTRISFGTLDDNFAHADTDLLNGAETLACYREWLGMSGSSVKTIQAGSHRTAKTQLFKSPTIGKLSLEMTRVIGMPHRWANIKDGDPYNEDDALIKFWRSNAGMR